MPAWYLIAAVSFQKPHMRDQMAQKPRVQSGRFSPPKPPSL